MTLDNFGRTSRAGHAYVFDAAPGLKLELMPHQRAALRWMLLRENRLAFHQNFTNQTIVKTRFKCNCILFIQVPRIQSLFM